MKKILVVLFLLTVCSFIKSYPAEAAELDISVPDNLTNLAIRNPHATSGTPVIECYAGSGNTDWTIWQDKNEQDLCWNNVPVGSECAGADITRGTSESKACYWKEQKKFHFSLNLPSTSDRGCQANEGAYGSSDPGGYGQGFITNMPNWETYYNSDYLLDNLAHLYVSATISLDNFSAGPSQYACQNYPSGCDSSGCDPIGYINMGVIINKFGSSLGDYQGTTFYALSPYDNRPNEPDYGANCSLPNPTALNNTVINSQDEITDSYYKSLGLLPILLGGTQSYTVDILPRIKQYIAQCESQLHNGAQADYNHFTLGSAYMTSESYNNVLMSFTVTNPIIKFVYKDGYTPVSIKKTCSLSNVSVSGSTLSFNFSGSRSSGTEDVNVWVSNADQTQAINPPPGTANPYNGGHYYNLGTCTSNASSGCSGSKTITNLPVGNYKMWCDMGQSQPLCSGNPFCTYKGGATDCSGWVECSANDNAAFTVNSTLPTFPPTSIPPRPTATKIPPTPTPIPIPGDITGSSGVPDKVVNTYDYNQLLSDFGKTGSPGWIASDINRDGRVDIFDYNILVGNWGKTQ